METKKRKRKKKAFSWKHLLFLPFLFLTFCEQNEDVLTQADASVEFELTKNSKVIALMKEAISMDLPQSKSDDDDDSDDDEQCVELQYPFAFYAILPGSSSIDTFAINSDEELFNFFDTLTETTEIRIDFPVVLTDGDGEDVFVNTVEELEETLEIIVDACRGNDNYEYCNDKQTKVYICHNGNTICVSVNAIKAHLDHGDVLGECDDDDNDD